jgi:uncharacterized protein (DUF1778 family)
MAKTPKKPISGGARIKLSGKSPVLLGILPEQKEVLQKAAELDGRPMTQFLLFHALAAAKKILDKSATKA